VNRFLEKDPRKRIDFKSAENHKWFWDLDLFQQQRNRTELLRKTRVLENDLKVGFHDIIYDRTSPVAINGNQRALNQARTVMESSDSGRN